MNPSTLPSLRLPGFKVIPKRDLESHYHRSQRAIYVLLGRRGSPEAPRERVLLVEYLDDFLDACQSQIEELWAKHRVLITHVAVKMGRGPRRAHGDLAETYARALTVQHLREKLHPRFRRL